MPVGLVGGRQCPLACCPAGGLTRVAGGTNYDGAPAGILASWLETGSGLRGGRGFQRHLAAIRAWQDGAVGVYQEIGSLLGVASSGTARRCSLCSCGIGLGCSQHYGRWATHGGISHMVSASQGWWTKGGLLPTGLLDGSSGLESCLVLTAGAGTAVLRPSAPDRPCHGGHPTRSTQVGSLAHDRLAARQLGTEAVLPKVAAAVGSGARRPPERAAGGSSQQSSPTSRSGRKACRPGWWADSRLAPNYRDWRRSGSLRRRQAPG